MSGEVAAAAAPALDARSRMILRYAFGVTLSFLISQTVEWPMGHLAPVFVAMFLAAMPRPLPLRSALFSILLIAAITYCGTWLAAFGGHYPGMVLLFSAIATFWTFMYGSSGGNPVLSVVLLVAVMVQPIVGLQGVEVARVVGLGVWGNFAIAIPLSYLAFSVLPPLDLPPSATAAKQRPSFDRRAGMALRATAIVLPLLVFFHVTGSGSLLVLVYVAMLAQQPTLRGGLQGAKAMFIGNLIGGAAAILGYELFVAMPQLSFATLVMALMSVWFGSHIFSGKPSAPLFGSAATALLLLLGASVSPFGNEADLNFYQRFAQVMIAGIYVPGAFMLSELLRPSKR